MDLLSEAREGLHPTLYQFRHYRGERMIWASGVGEISDTVFRGTPAELEIIKSQLWQPNELTNEGEQAMLDVFFRGGTTPTFAFRLYDDTPVDTDSLSDLVNEVSGSGYDGITVSRNTTDWPTLELDAGDYRVVSATKTFEATGAWSTASTLVLASATSGTAGTFYAWAPLSQDRTLGDGDSLDVAMRVKAA